MSATVPILRFSEVRFRYPAAPAPVLDGVSLAVGAGDGIALFGANGAGKTTLLRLAMGLVRGAEGGIALGDLRAGADPEDHARIAGYLFQQPEAQLFERTVAREIGFGPRCLGWDEGRIAAAVREALDEVGLADAADEHPYNLPAPHRRLVALAAVIAANPPLLLLDEPTAGLDRGSRAVVRDAVLRRREQGTGVLAVTHDGEFALEALDGAVLLERGRIAASGSVIGLLGRPGTPASPLTAQLASRLALALPVPRFDAVVGALCTALPHPHTEH